MTLSWTRRRVLAVPLTLPLAAPQSAPSVAAAALAASPLAQAQTYPNRPLKLVVPFPPGGPTDIVGRPLAQMLGEALGHNVVVENLGGAGGSIGAAAVSKAAPDGYTLLMGTVGTSAINATLYRKLPYDPLAGFTPIATVASAPVAIVVNAGTGIGSVADLVAQAKARPGAISYGSAGNGTPGHLVGAMFSTAAGIRLQHVPYRGSAPAINDLLGGQIPLMFDPVQSVLQHVHSGRLRALAVSGRERSPVLPQVPTVAESGFDRFEATAWWAVFAPPGLPAEVTARLRREIARIVGGPVLDRQLRTLGVRTLDVPLGPFQKAEIDKWGAAVRASGVALD